MNRGERRAQWLSRIRRQGAAGRRIEAGPMRSARPRIVRVRVGELALHGFSPAAAQRIRAAFEHELASLLGSSNLPPIWRTAGSMDRAHAAPVRLRSMTDAGSIARQLAAALVGLQPDARKPERLS